MKWQTLAGPKHTYSAVARNSNGRLELFALADDGDIYHCWQLEAGYSDMWSQWRSLGGEWVGASPRSFAIGMSGRGCLELFVVADGAPPYANGQIFHNKQTHLDEGEGKWTGWHGLHAKDTDGWSKEVGPTVVRNKDGFLDLFVMSADRGVLKEYWWSDYTNSTGVGHFSQAQDETWSGPETRLAIETCIEATGQADYSCKSKLPTRLVTALNSDGKLELFANAGDLEAKRRGLPGLTHIPAHLWHARQTGDHINHWGSSSVPMPPGFTDVLTDSDTAATQPSVVVNHEGNLEVYIWGNTDHGIWVKQEDPGVEGRWLPWRNIGGTREWRCPVVVSDGNNMLTVLASSMTANDTWYLTQFLDSEGRAAWPDEWRPITEDGDEQGKDLLHAITNQYGRIELFASGPDRAGFWHRYQQVTSNLFEADDPVASRSR